MPVSGQLLHCGLRSTSCYLLKDFTPSHHPLYLLHHFFFFLFYLVSPLVCNHTLVSPTFFFLKKKKRALHFPIPQSFQILHHFCAAFHSKASGTSCLYLGSVLLTSYFLFESSQPGFFPQIPPLKPLLGLLCTCTGAAERVWRETHNPAA